MKRRISEAVRTRTALLADPSTDVCRVVHGAADGIDGLFADRYGPGLTMARHIGRVDPRARPEDLAAALLEELDRFGVRAVYAKPFVRDRSRHGPTSDATLHDPQPIAGAPLPESLSIREDGRVLEVRLFDGFSTGLFLDQRGNRSFLGPSCPGGHVLNTFAYTSAFSVACALGGATVTSVDVSGRYLEWSRRNFALNGIDPLRHHFARMDTREFVSMAIRKGLRFDLVILDPPTFSSADRRGGFEAWSAPRDLGPLVSLACGVLNEGGAMFVSTNATELTEGERLRRLIEESAGPVSWLDAPPTPADFPGGRDCARWVYFRPGRSRQRAR